MKQELIEILEQQVRKSIFTANRDKLADICDNLLTIVMSQPKTKKLLFDSIVINVDILVKPIEEEKPKEKKPKQPKEPKPVKKPVKRMTDIELAQAIAKEVDKVPDDIEDVAEPLDEDTQSMLN
jgi:hypothetical protein